MKVYKKIVILFLLFLYWFAPFQIIEGNTTQLIFEPQFSIVPYPDWDNTYSFVELNLNVLNVVNLTEYKIIFDFDDEILEYYGIEINGTFYLANSEGSDFDLINEIQEFTGSKTLHKITFRVKKEGSTSITLEDSLLIDNRGNNIPFNVKSSLVNIISFEEYYNISYSILEDNYEELLYDYDNLDTDYENLMIDYEILVNKESDLREEMEYLFDERNELQEQFEKNLEEYNNLSLICTDLSNNYLELQVEYDKLTQKLNSSMIDFDQNRQKLYETRNYLVLSIMVSVIVIIINYYDKLVSYIKLVKKQ